MTTPAEHTRPRTLEESLEPCPFCGTKGDAVSMAGKRDGWSGIDYELAVRCGFCGAFGPSADTEDAAVSEWNRRHRG